MLTNSPARRRLAVRLAFPLAMAAVAMAGSSPLEAQERLPWLRDQPPAERSFGSTVERERLPESDPEPFRNSAPAAGRSSYPSGGDGYRPPTRSDAYGSSARAPRDDAYRPPARGDDAAPRTYGRYDDPPRDYDPPRSYRDRSDDPAWRDEDARSRYRDRHAAHAPPYHDREPHPNDGTFSMREIVDAGHGFFGSISQGLASVIEYAFKTQGRPNGYILGEDIGGAFVAGLRYGEGRLFTRDAGTHRVFWQGPSVGYDAGAEGSKVMVLVYNLRSPEDIYQRFGGVAGSAYMVGGVGINFQKRDDVVLAPIRAGLGLRLGANVGYLKYTRRPTWNPF